MPYFLRGFAVDVVFDADVVAIVPAIIGTVDVDGPIATTCPINCTNRNLLDKTIATLEWSFTRMTAHMFFEM
ncbi:hypothetical protein DERF_005520 [Dermatophagoides farinae]|uniref:Uncharacterized protein n=1 Tax=Dermatophagoides farinae TaxID=6954 RepID=A0A922LBC6_DERFA|nr:hypothetical protein DERF_005520 [Dermatophagoides farinae]